jgi:signal transduction histidine kinase
LEQQSRELVEETFRRNQAMTLAMMGIEALARGHRLKNEAATVNLTLENLDVIVPRLVRAQSAWYSKLLRIFPGWEYSEKLVGELKRIGSALRLVEVSELTSRPERDQEIRIKKWAEDIANQWHTRFADETMTDLRQELSVSEEDRVMAAPGLLKRALDNLIDNAFRSARECPKPLVVFRVLQDEDNVRIEVEDNGKGFPESVSLFLFKSEIPEGTEGVKSMGLGCLLTGFIVRAYGGTVRFANLEAGRGAKVWVTLPRISKR